MEEEDRGGGNLVRDGGMDGRGGRLDKLTS